MKCPNCGHELPLGKEKCMYCGAALSEMDSASVKDTSKTKRAPHSDNAGQDADEAETSPGREAAVDIKPGLSEEYLSLQLSLAKAKRRIPMNRLTLLLIFVASAAFMAFIVWLMS